MCAAIQLSAHIGKRSVYFSLTCHFIVSAVWLVVVSLVQSAGVCLVQYAEVSQVISISGGLCEFVQYR